MGLEEKFYVAPSEAPNGMTWRERALAAEAEGDRLREDVAHLLDGIDFTPTRIMDEGDADRLNDFIEQIGAMLKQRLRRALATLYRYRVQMVATVEAHDAEQAAAIASERHGPAVRVMKVERGPRARRALEGSD